MSKPVLIMFGGISPEHEVSVISGLQIVENIDRNLYEPHTIYITKTGNLEYIHNLQNRKQFPRSKRTMVTFGHNDQGGYLKLSGLLGKRIYPYSVYLAFHGGQGEGGGVQGLLETLNLPHTSTPQESAAITMNKQLTKEQVGLVGIQTVPGLSFFSSDIKKNPTAIAKQIKTKLGLPVILKPVHLGSSIGIKIAKNISQLEQYLLESAHLDHEILIEKYLTGFTEYNCAVRLINGKLQSSEIEKPLSKDEILSFADKYERGSKKTGGGMASLQRELPAKIPLDLKNKIQVEAKKAFFACRCKGMVRIDFMLTKDGKIYLTEINPIPGSMAFYLWEATGIPFKQQITDLIEQSIKDHQSLSTQTLDYQTNIVEKFVSNQ